MAQNLVLNILAKDKTRVAFGAIQRGLSNLRASVFSVQIVQQVLVEMVVAEL